MRSTNWGAHAPSQTPRPGGPPGPPRPGPPRPPGAPGARPGPPGPRPPGGEKSAKNGPPVTFLSNRGKWHFWAFFGPKKAQKCHFPLFDRKVTGGPFFALFSPPGGRGPGGPGRAPGAPGGRGGPGRGGPGGPPGRGVWEGACAPQFVDRICRSRLLLQGGGGKGNKLNALRLAGSATFS